MNRDRHIKTNAEKICVLCNCKPYQHPYTAMGWKLTNYHGLTGHFCSDCYNLVAHDAFGIPLNPEGYAYAIGALVL